MKKTLILSALLVAAALPLSAQEQTATPSLSGVASEVVATVNGHELTRDQLAALAVAIYGRQILETLIAQEAVRQEAAKQGVSITKEEIEEYARKRVQEQLDDMARKSGATDLADLVARSGQPPDAAAQMRAKAEAALRPFVEPELLATKLIARGITVTDDDVLNEYDRRYGAKARVLQIVLETEAEAQGVIEKLRMGADFGQLAQEVSKDTVSRRHNGEMPPLPITALLGAAASKLKPGEISEPIQTPDGFHVLKLVELIPAGNAVLEDVKETLRADVLERRIRDDQEDWLRALLGRTDIKRTFGVPTP